MKSDRVLDTLAVACVVLFLALVVVVFVGGCDKRAGVPYHSHPTAPADTTHHDDDD